MAADQLGHRMHDECGPKLDGPAEERGEGVVDQHGNSGLAADPGDRLEVGDPEQGIGDGLDQDQPGSRCDLRWPELSGWAGIEAIVGHSEPGELPGHQGGRLAIEPFGDQDVIALAGEGEEGGGDGGHSRRADQSGLGFLEVGQLGGELDRVGMAVAGVEEAAVAGRRRGRRSGPGRQSRKRR